MTLREYGALETGLGANVVEYDHTWWRWTRWGFLRPLFPFDSFDRRSRRIPRQGRWLGYQHAVRSASRANSVLRLIVFEKLREYSLGALPKRLRQRIRKGLEIFRVEQILDPVRFTEEAWPVYCAFFRRTGYKYRSDRIRKERFAEWAAALFSRPEVQVLGAYDANGLAGIDSLWPVEDVVVAGPTFSRTDALKGRVSDVLLHALREKALQLLGSRILVMGWLTGIASLDGFKLERGARLLELPAYAWLAPWTRSLVRFAGARAGWRLGLRPSVPQQENPTASHGVEPQCSAGSGPRADRCRSAYRLWKPHARGETVKSADSAVGAADSSQSSIQVVGNKQLNSNLAFAQPLHSLLICRRSLHF